MEFNSRTRINLSPLAKAIIKRDMLIFNAIATFNEGSFINLIIQSYLKKDFDINYSYSKLKGDSKTYYIQDENIDKLEYFKDDNRAMNQFTTSSEFLKAVVESYCRKSCLEREYIILRESIDEMNYAIENHKKIKLTIQNKTTSDLMPYKIAPANEMIFSYLIADDGNRFAAYRISTIKAIRTLNKEFKPKKDEFAKIEDLIIEYGPTFAFEPNEEVIVQFLTPESEASYLYSAIHRPIHTQIIDTKNRIYKFYCSMKQAKYFFFRFCGDVKILKPTKLKETLKNMYKSGFEEMSKD